MTCSTYIVHLTDTNHSMAIVPTKESGEIEVNCFEEITFLRKASKNSTSVTKEEERVWRDGKGLKTRAALVKDLSSIPNTHVVRQLKSACNSSCGDA